MSFYVVHFNLLIMFKHNPMKSSSAKSSVKLKEILPSDLREARCSESIFRLLL